jgi:hypothetical protein
MMQSRSLFRPTTAAAAFGRSSGFRRSLASEAGQQPAVRSTASNKAPLSTRLAWFSYGLNITLALGLYQLGQDASEASKKLEEALMRIREDTAATQRGLRAKIAKVEAALGEATMKLEDRGH